MKKLAYLLKNNNFLFSVKVFIGFFALIFAIFLGITHGTEKITFSQIVLALFNPDKAEIFATIIIRNIRLPRVFLAALCGALLAGSGAVFQGFFRNPLADSGVMGVSSGAALGAVFSALIPFQALSLPAFLSSNITAFCAFLGSTLAVFLIFAASKIPGQQNSTSIILLTGTAASTFFASVTSLIILLKDNELHKMFVWTLGSFNGKGWKEFFLILPLSFVATLLMIFSSSFLDIFSGGRATALSLGLNVKKAQWLTLGSASLGAAAAVCIGGTIGFVGLIIPHLVRRIYSPRHSILVPISLIWGATFLIIADTIARTIASPSELPVGIVTALIGAPFFVSLLFSTRSTSHE